MNSRFCLNSRLLRSAGISTEIYPDVAKLRKQFAYADTRKIPFVIIAGSDELKNDQATVKDMITGIQKTIALSELPDAIKNNKF